MTSDIQVSKPLPSLLKITATLVDKEMEQVNGGRWFVPISKEGEQNLSVNTFFSSGEHIISLLKAKCSWTGFTYVLSLVCWTITFMWFTQMKVGERRHSHSSLITDFISPLANSNSHVLLFWQCLRCMISVCYVFSKNALVF